MAVPRKAVGAVETAKRAAKAKVPVDINALVEDIRAMDKKLSKDFSDAVEEFGWTLKLQRDLNDAAIKNLQRIL